MVPIRTLLDLFTYAACIFGVLPLYAFLELPGKILFPAALVTGFICDRRQRYFLGPLPATLLSILPFVIYGLRLSLASVVEPVVNLLVLLLAIRLVTEKQPRHYLQIFVLAIFSLAASSLLTLGLLFLPVLVLQVTSVTLGLVLLTFHGSDQQMCLPAGSLRPLFVVSLVLPVGSLLLMQVFFAVLPRTQYPLWNFLNPDPTAVSGFSENVRPGAFARHAASGALVFRVESEPLGVEDLYWRGIVLNVAEGNNWRREIPPAGENVRLSGGRQVSQVVYPEGREDTYLFALDPTDRIDGLRSGSSVDLVHRRRRSSQKPVSYRTVARVGADLVAKGVNRDFYLQTPGTVSQRLRDAAAELAAGGDDAAARIARTEEFFRSQKLIYATSDLPGAERPMEEFLFDKKRGYCEFFAGSFALLLRLEGVPARLVGGYHGGSRNELAGYYTITEEMAHVWVEVLVDGAWRRIDPSRLAVNAASASFAGRGSSLAWHRRLLDTADYYWTRAVISYDLNTQVGLVRGTVFKLRGLSLGPGIIPVAGWLIAVAGGLFAAGWLLRLLAVPVEVRLMKRFVRLLERRFGIEGIRDTAGLHTLAERTGDPRCREFAAILGGAVFRDRPLRPAERSRLRSLLRAVKRNR
jgi:transglutaminase-like putative cysteine protease